MSRSWLGGWSLEARLAAVALGLGLLALFGDPFGGGTVRVNARELAAIVEGEADHVTVDELADWIVQGRNDYRLIDVRDAAAYAEYHIPTAESVQLTDLIDYPLSRSEKIVLYSDGSMHSAQAWFLLKAQGYPGAYILLYGLEEWKERVLFPALAAGASPEQTAEFQRRSQVSAFFGGSPRTGEAGTIEQVAFQMPEAPASGPTPVAAGKRKKKEGC
jgi:rhodanese-related sulfurtransferase